MNLLTSLVFWTFIVSLVGVAISFQFLSLYRSKIRFGIGSVLREAYYQRARLAGGFLIVFSTGVIVTLSSLIHSSINAERFPWIPKLLPTSPSMVTESPPVHTIAPSTPTATTTPHPTASPSPTAISTPIEALPLKARVGNTGNKGVNVRANPGLNSPIIAQLRDGTPVTLLSGTRLEDDYNWQEVELEDGRRGWIANYFLLPDN